MFRNYIRDVLADDVMAAKNDRGYSLSSYSQNSHLLECCD